MNNLIDYFSFNENDDPEKWSSSLNKFHYSGFNLVDEINLLNPSLVLDLGCGYNEFKGKIQNVIGIDIANINADVLCDFTDYECKNNSVDVVLALGSINFISLDKIEQQIKWIHDKLKPGGYAFIRVNPTQSPGKAIENDFYIWREEDIWYFKEKYNFKLPKNAIVKEFTKENRISKYRYFFIFQK